MICFRRLRTADSTITIRTRTVAMTHSRLISLRGSVHISASSSFRIFLDSLFARRIRAGDSVEDDTFTDIASALAKHAPKRSQFPCRIKTRDNLPIQTQHFSLDVSFRSTMSVRSRWPKFHIKERRTFQGLHPYLGHAEIGFLALFTKSIISFQRLH